MSCGKPVVKTGTGGKGSTHAQTGTMWRKRLTHAHDFAGLGTSGLALQKLVQKANIKTTLKHLFSSDKLRASKKFIELTDPPEIFYPDVLKRHIPEKFYAPDLYTFTAPCQGLSPAGIHLGIEDARTRLALAGVIFIQDFHPKAIMSENTYTLATWEKHREFLEFIVTTIKDAGPGYHVEWKLLNSNAYVPQHRLRWYLLGVRSDLKRANTCGVTLWPDPPRTCASFECFVKSRVGKQDWKPFPTDCSPDEQNNILTAYENCGVNPFVVPVVVDFKASPKFSSWRPHESMTLTRTRCGQFGYWCSTKGAPLDVSDLCRLQGFHPDDLPYKEADVTDTSMSQVLGNGQTFSICLAILPHLLYHASLITLHEFVAMKVASENCSPLQR